MKYEVFKAALALKKLLKIYEKDKVGLMRALREIAATDQSLLGKMARNKLEGMKNANKGNIKEAGTKSKRRNT